MQPRDFKGEGHRLLRWTELFVIQIEDSVRSSSNRIEDNGDITRFAETLAKAASMALAAKLASLEPHTLIGIRVSLDGDSVIGIILFHSKFYLGFSTLFRWNTKQELEKHPFRMRVSRNWIHRLSQSYIENLQVKEFPV